MAVANLSQVQATVDAAADFTALVEKATFASLDPATVESARLCLVDTLGCAIAGHDADGVGAVRGLVLDTGGRPQSAVWGTGGLVPAEAAAFANSLSGHALDYDDQHPGVLHTGVCVVPSSIAMCEAGDVRSIERLLEAIVVGTEVADRLAVATTVGPGSSGWLLTPICGYFGAAAAAAKIARLDNAGIRNALGFAYVQTSGNGQSTLDGALAKRMQPAFAARGGVFAAELSRRGLTAPWDSLEGRRGFFHVYHQDQYSPEALRDGLGSRWLIDIATFKPYPCCAWTHAAIECGMALRDDVDASQIAEVRIGVNAQAYQSTGTPLPRRYRPRTEVDAQFSIPYMFALAFVHGAVTMGDFSPTSLARPDLVAVAERVTVHIDDELQRAQSREISPARTVVTLVDGSTREVVVMQPRGMGDRRLTRPDLEAKFRSCCEFGGMSAAKTERIADIVLDGTGECLPELFGLLAEPR